MPNPDGSETEQERYQRQLMQTHGATTNAAAPTTAPVTSTIQGRHYDKQAGTYVGGDPQFTEPNTAGHGNSPYGENAASAFSDSNNAKPPATGAPDTGGLMADRSRYLSAYDEWMNQQRQPGVTPPPQVSANIDDGQGQQIRGDQVDYLGALKARAAGQGPSVAQAQMNQGISAAARSSLGMAAQARGADAAAARRQAILGNADAGARASGDAALLRATEQTQAQQLYGGALAGVRGQDTGLAVERGRLGLEADATNAGNNLNAQGLEIGRQAGLRGSALQAGGQATGAALSAEDLAYRYKALQQQKELTPEPPGFFDKYVLPFAGGAAGAGVGFLAGGPAGVVPGATLGIKAGSAAGGAR
jgi:hypothetical protein